MSRKLHILFPEHCPDPHALIVARDKQAASRVICVYSNAVKATVSATTVLFGPTVRGEDPAGLASFDSDVICPILRQYFDILAPGQCMKIDLEDGDVLWP